MKNEILSSGSYVPEDFDSFIKRYSGFGKNLYEKLENEYPAIFAYLSFYRRVDYQTEDSYAIFDDSNKAFAIQLDPLCEVIVLWGNHVRIEIGTWSLDEYAESITFIREELLKY